TLRRVPLNLQLRARRGRGEKRNQHHRRTSHRWLSSFGLFLRFFLGLGRREVLRPPLVPSTEETRYVLDAVSIEIKHRTGAGVLGHSSTVGDDELVFWQLLLARSELGERDVDRALDVLHIVRILRAHIDEDGLV